jgi:hypothetical protein
MGSHETVRTDEDATALGIFLDEREKKALAAASSRTNEKL